MSVKTSNKGRVARVIGPVVDIEFPADSMPAIFNAANEEAVAAFLKGQIKFTEIIEIVDAVLQQLAGNAPATLSDIADVSAIEDDARRVAHEVIKRAV